MRDFLIYVVIGLAVLGTVLWLAIYEPHLSLDEFRTWFGFAWFTALLAAIIVKMYWRARKKTKLWAFLSLFLAAHVAAYLVLLHYVPDWPAIWYIPIGSAEVMLFVLLAKLWLDVLPSTTKL